MPFLGYYVDSGVAPLPTDGLPSLGSRQCGVRGFSRGAGIVWQHRAQDSVQESAVRTYDSIVPDSLKGYTCLVDQKAFRKAAEVRAYLVIQVKRWMHLTREATRRAIRVGAFFSNCRN